MAADEDVPFDPWADLIAKLETAKRELQALEPRISRLIRTGGVQRELADELGVAPEELDEAFLDEDEPPMDELTRRLRTGIIHKEESKKDG